MKYLLTVLTLFAFISVPAFGQDKSADDEKKTQEVIKAAITKLGGAKYLKSTSVASEGKFSITKEQQITSFQSFTDVIVFPDRERTDFVEQGSRTIQVNTGSSGWIFQEFLGKFGDQDEEQIKGFHQSLRTHYDFLLRGRWKDVAELSYAGRRQASLGKRNDVLKLEFEDEFWVEYEFDDDGLPMKAVYSSKNEEGGIITEENRYAQFILVDGIFFPYVVDHFTDGKRSFRVNYTEVRYNLRFSDSIFAKPADPKKIKKLKF